MKERLCMSYARIFFQWLCFGFVAGFFGLLADLPFRDRITAGFVAGFVGYCVVDLIRRAQHWMLRS
jgi:hypothetical protein